MKLQRFCFVVLGLASSAVFNIPSTLWACQIQELKGQLREMEVALRDDVLVEEKSVDSDEEKTSNEDNGSITDTAATSDQGEIGDKFIRFHMWDGLIVGGEVTVDKIEVETEFGTLQIPIDQILKFHPGLDSLSSLNEKISTLVENLGDKNFDTREQSHRELVSMGTLIRHEIQRFDDGGSAERKKHLEDIKKQIDEIMDDRDEIDVTDVEPALIRGDTIVTEEFSIVGKIKQNQFRLGSKFGELHVNLADIKLADRTFNQTKQDIHKTVEVDAKSFFQKKPTSTRIRVNRGDRVSIRASGVVQWTNWSTSSGPDGLTNQGQWQGINSGTLVARVGNSSKYIKIGTKEDFTAAKSGVLYLGIAVRDNYASNSSYRWEGNYTAKVKVKPAPK